MHEVKSQPNMSHSFIKYHTYISPILLYSSPLYIKIQSKIKALLCEQDNDHTHYESGKHTFSDMPSGDESATFSERGRYVVNKTYYTGQREI